MKTQMKVLLHLSYTKQNSFGLCPLMGKITISGKKNSIVQFSTKLKVDSRLWNSTSQRCIGKSNVAIKTNREIEALLLLLRSRFDELSKVNDALTAIDVKNAFQGSEQSQIMLLQLFRNYNDEYKQRVGVNRTHNSLYKYQNTYNLTHEFINAKCKVKDVTLKSLDMLFVEQFDAFLRVDKKQLPNTRRGHIVRLTSVIKTNGLNPFKGYKCEQPIQRQRYLSQDDLNQLMTIKPSTNTRELVRDMFLFSVFTGICYCDIQNLTKEHIKQDKEGNLWIDTIRQKTGTPEKVLLLDIAKEIIAKYNRGERLFPRMTYRSMMKQLKKLAAECGITRNLTFHMARHTFASEICISGGVPIESVSKAMGHKDITTTQRYAKVTYEKIDRDMTMLNRKLNKLYA